MEENSINYGTKLNSADILHGNTSYITTTARPSGVDARTVTKPTLPPHPKAHSEMHPSSIPYLPLEPLQRDVSILSNISGNSFLNFDANEDIPDKKEIAVM